MSPRTPRTPRAPKPLAEEIPHHSPHPWRLYAHRSPARIESSAGGSALALVYLTNPRTRKREATYAMNARLMQHAPELYAMVQRLRDAIFDAAGPDDPTPYCVEDANALLRHIDG